MEIFKHENNNKVSSRLFPTFDSWNYFGVELFGIIPQLTHASKLFSDCLPLKHSWQCRQDEVPLNKTSWVSQQPALMWNRPEDDWFEKIKTSSARIFGKWKYYARPWFGMHIFLKMRPPCELEKSYYLRLQTNAYQIFWLFCRFHQNTCRHPLINFQFQCLLQTEHHSLKC